MLMGLLIRLTYPYPEPTATCGEAVRTTYHPRRLMSGCFDIVLLNIITDGTLYAVVSGLNQVAIYRCKIDLHQDAAL